MADAAGLGVQSVPECVGSNQAMLTAVGIARPGGAIGRVGVPHYEAIPTSLPEFYNKITVSGSPAPVRAYIEELQPDVLEGKDRAWPRVRSRHEHRVRARRLPCDQRAGGDQGHDRVLKQRQLRLQSADRRSPLWPNPCSR